MIIKTKFSHLRLNTSFEYEGREYVKGNICVGNICGMIREYISTQRAEYANLVPSVTHSEPPVHSLFAFHPSTEVYADDSRVRTWYQRLFGLNK